MSKMSVHEIAYVGNVVHHRGKVLSRRMRRTIAMSDTAADGDDEIALIMAIGGAAAEEAHP